MTRRDSPSRDTGFRIKVGALGTLLLIMISSTYVVLFRHPESPSALFVLVILFSLSAGIISALFPWNSAVRKAIGTSLVVAAAVSTLLAVPGAFYSSSEGTEPDTSMASPPSSLSAVTVTVERIVDLRGSAWLSPDGDPLAAPTPEECSTGDGPQRWMDRTGAIEVGRNLVAVAVTASTESHLQIERVRLSSFKRSPALKGSVTMSPCLGGGPPPKKFEIHLRPGGGQVLDPGAVVPEDFAVFELAPGQTRVFYLEAIAHEGQYQWSAKIRMRAGMAERTIEIGTSQAPFMVTSHG